MPNSVTELLQALVRIPSVNPAGNPGAAPDPAITGEKACATYLAEFLKTLGAEVSLEEVLPDRPNVVGIWPTSTQPPDQSRKPWLVFGPHTDTVSVAGMSIAPFSGENRDGCIWGRGATDTKGPMSAMLWALRENRDILPHLSHQIVFAGFVGEEAGQHGAKAFLGRHESSLRTPGSLVMAGEPTGLETVIAHRGTLWLTLNTRGRAVHASQPHLGDNAIYKMADILRAVRDEIAPAIAKNPHPLLGSNTISAGVVTGGSKANIVPDFCQAELDIRFSPGSEHLPQEIAASLKKICPEVEIEENLNPPMYTDPSHPLLQALAANGSRQVGAPWFSDAGIFSAGGIPAVAMGPGSIHQAHTKDEFMKISDLEAGVEFLGAFLRKLKLP